MMLTEIDRLRSILYTCPVVPDPELEDSDPEVQEPDDHVVLDTIPVGYYTDDRQFESDTDCESEDMDADVEPTRLVMLEGKSKTVDMEIMVVDVEETDSKNHNRTHLNIKKTIAFLGKTMWFVGLDNLFYAGLILLAGHFVAGMDTRRRIADAVPGRPMFTSDVAETEHVYEAVLEDIREATTNEVLLGHCNSVLSMYHQFMEIYAGENHKKVNHTKYNEIALKGIQGFTDCMNTCGNLWKSYTYAEYYNR